MPSPTQITVSQLSRLVGTPDCPVLIDVTIDQDFNENPYLIPSAKRQPFNRMDEIAPDLQNRKVVVICQKGLKLSEGAAAILRNHGVDAENLEGGNIGWREASQMRVSNKAIPWSKGNRTLWVTRHRPKIDRIACPWLIKRFVDPNAQFLFVAPSQVTAVAQRFGATPFDVDGVEWSHQAEKCTFETMLEIFSFTNPALDKIASIVRAADTDQIESIPEAAGLLAISLGVSRMYKDDLKQLDAAMIIYDSLYRWTRDATSERHSSAFNSTAGL